jgi:hypothetical protein
MNKPGKELAIYDPQVAAAGLAAVASDTTTPVTPKPSKPLSKAYPTKKYVSPHSYLLTGETLAKQIVGGCGGDARQCDGYVRHGDRFDTYTSRNGAITAIVQYHPTCVAVPD